MLGNARAGPASQALGRRHAACPHSPLEEVLEMPLAVRAIIGVLTVSAVAAGTIAAWVIGDIPRPPLHFELLQPGFQPQDESFERAFEPHRRVYEPQRDVFESRRDVFESQRGVFDPQRGGAEAQREPVQPPRSSGMEHAPRPYRRVVEVLALAGPPPIPS
jgi:hypothetical protein